MVPRVGVQVVHEEFVAIGHRAGAVDEALLGLVASFQSRDAFHDGRPQRLVFGEQLTELDAPLLQIDVQVATETRHNVLDPPVKPQSKTIHLTLNQCSDHCILNENNKLNFPM